MPEWEIRDEESFVLIAEGFRPNTFSCYEASSDRSHPTNGQSTKVGLHVWQITSAELRDSSPRCSMCRLQWGEVSATRDFRKNLQR